MTTLFLPDWFVILLAVVLMLTVLDMLLKVVVHVLNMMLIWQRRKMWEATCGGDDG